MKIFRRILNTTLVVLALILLVTGSALLYLTMTDYKPAAVEKLEIQANGIGIPQYVRNINLLSWNIGYAGLGKEMDFFYDGGKRVRAPFQDYQRYLNGVLSTLSRMDTLDFFLLQEVDRNARRSYFSDQESIISAAFPDFNSSFANNYDVKCIPFPLLDPMGKVLAGQFTLSRFKPLESERIASPVNFSWPKRLFFLDRCFLVNRYRISGDTSLVVVNLHNSAWLEGAELRKAEVDLLKKTILAEYNKGNYVIVGGDWNMNPPGFNPVKFASPDKVWKMQAPLEQSFMPRGWTWAFDSRYPSNRDVSGAYQKGKTLTTLIDFFLLSPNIRLVEVKTLKSGFEYSDHNPVYLNIHLGTDTIKAGTTPSVSILK